MSQVSDISKLAGAFKKSCSVSKPDVAACLKQLSGLRVQMLSLNLLPPFEDSKTATLELSVARDILEQATLLSIKAKDSDMFRRYFSQVRTYYYDYKSLLPASDLEEQLVGLNLMYLLSSNDLSEFHTELELIPIEKHESKYIQFPINLEQTIMEGGYNSVLSASDNVPSPAYIYFLEPLSETVRNRIGSCIEKAYPNLLLKDAQELLMLKTLQQAKDFAEQRGWIIDGNNKLSFPKGVDTSMEIPSMKLIQQHLDYANELERIV